MRKLTITAFLSLFLVMSASAADAVKATIHADKAGAKINREIYGNHMAKFPNTFCVIKQFTGEVIFETKKERYYDEKLPITTIIGKGSTNFHSGFIDDDDSVKLHLSECNMLLSHNLLLPAQPRLPPQNTIGRM